MVLPLIGALAGAGGSIGAALIGAEAQDSANETNWRINLYNARQRDKERQAYLDFADEIRNEQKLGATDAYGNRTYFDEDQGWLTELSPDQQQLYDYFFNQELPERQSQFKRSAELSRGDADIAGALINEFRRITRGDPREAEALLYEVATRGIGDATRDTTEAAMRQGIRTGNSNISNIIAEIGKANMETRRDASVNAKLQAEDYVNSKYNSERGQTADLYNAFAQRARQELGTSYDPSGVAASGNNLLNLFSRLAQQGGQIGANAQQMRGGSIDYVEPNLGWANAAGAIGASLSGLGDRAGSYMDKQRNDKLLMDYITGGGQLDLTGGGIFGTIADRTRVGSDRGVF